MRRVLVILGTRPEAVKLGPVVGELRRPDSGFEARVCITGQHRDLMEAPLKEFALAPDENLGAMLPGQTLTASAGKILARMDGVLVRFRPHAVVVQGDTTSTFCGALAAFYAGVPVAHVEAGLRTPQARSPFPEEMNRRLTSRLTALHLAATEWAARNLIAEDVAPEAVRVTGNPGIDALMRLRRTRRRSPSRRPWSWRNRTKKLLAVTAHRRESFGRGLVNICEAAAALAQRGDVELAWPLHPNPEVRRTVLGRLSAVPNVHLLPPLDYPEFIDLLAAADMALTDSGGVQEEAPSLGTPVVVLRETTERPEAVEAGTAVLAGCDASAIVSAACALLDNPAELRLRSRIHNPYGDGHAAPRIAEALRELLGVERLAAAG